MGIDVAAMVVDLVYGQAPSTTIRSTKDFSAASWVSLVAEGVEGGAGGTLEGFWGVAEITRTAPTGVERGMDVRVRRESSGR